MITEAELPPSDPASESSAGYWEARALRFAGDGEGLAAVCSYGMPEFYNRSIQLCQRLALAPWLGVEPDDRVLDVGCGVGRWSRQLARSGALVTGVDLAPTMVEEARRRAARDGVAGRCRFLAADLAELDLGERFDRILGVTVLQHLLDDERLRAAIERLVDHLAPGGRIVLLEAMPTRTIRRCDTAVFTARRWNDYRQLFVAAGLRVAALSGVDPAPFKTLFLPYYRRLPRPLANACLALLTGLGLPWDLVLGRRMVASS